MTEYARDGDGDLASITCPSGLHVKYVLDPATKRPVRVENETTAAADADQVSWMPAGPLAPLDQE